MLASRTSRITGLGLAGLLLVPGATEAGGIPAGGGTELVMFVRQGCVWCERWDHEVATVYPKTPEGRTAPLRRVDIAGSREAEPWLTAPVRFTPTFILRVQGREVGRITGYGGDAAFWGLLGAMLGGMTARDTQSSPLSRVQ
jgi:hypothetical protein